MLAGHDDAELVAGSLAGQRDAFGQIVERYQSLICSLAYCATGSLSQSEDLAQETFIAAWKQLPQLREPRKLRSWLCGIARNVTGMTLRRLGREPIHGAEPLDVVQESAVAQPLPSDHAITKEEEAILNRSLERIPEAYREPLVLFYRQGQSVERVAEALELSQDAVKQRLSRGRKLLREEVLAFVEGALAQTNPGKAFTLGVLAALPAVVASSATAAALGATGKAAAPAAKLFLSAATMGAWLGFLGGLLGGAIGSWASWETARYQRERQLLRRSLIFYGAALSIFSAPFLAMRVTGWRLVGSHPLGYAIALAAWILGFVLLSLFWSLRLARQARRLRAEEIAAGTAPLPESALVRRWSRWGSKWEGRQWRSTWSLLGLPLIDINFSSPDPQSFISKATVSALLPGKARIARGWIALGDRAHGLLFACGNIAIGGIAIGGACAGVLAIGGAAAGLVCVGGGAVGALALGGLAVGAIAWGGVALGAWAFGGLAIGWMAFGGGALAWRAAEGGLACAHDVALGGKAIATHANDVLARGFVSHNWFFSAADWQRTHLMPWVQSPWFPTAVLAFSILLSAFLFAVGYRRRKAVALGALAALCLLFQTAGAAEPRTEARTLANGIRAVSVCFPGSTNVSIFTYLPLGLASDGPQQAQWSHLVEHLVLRSTGLTDLSRANAETLPGCMRLDFYGDARNWKEGLSHHRRWLEGAPFSEASLEAEKPRVKSECDWTAKGFATHKFALAAWAQGYRHNQNHAALKGDIDRVSLGDIQKYRDNRLVVLSNIVVCVVGGVQPAKALPACAEALGAVKSGNAGLAPVVLHPGNREMTWDLDARHLVLTWPIPAPAARDFPALLVAAQWLNMQFFNDPEARKLTGMVFAGADLAAPEGNFFYVTASLRPGSSFTDVQKRLEHHLQRLASPDEDLSLLPMFGGQLAGSLTQVPDPRLVKGQLPPSASMAMLEGNLGLQWGMNEYYYGPDREVLAKRLVELKTEHIRQAVSNHLAAAKCSIISLRPRGDIGHAH